jgi:hypothetical protein
MRLSIILFFLLQLQQAHSQINIYTDLGSFLTPRPIGGDRFIEKILMRPNIGIEKTNNLKTTSFLLMYKKNHGFGIYYRGFDSQGFRFDVSRKKYFPNNQRMYIEGQLRFETVSAKDAHTRHRNPDVDLNSKNFQIGIKIGARGKYIRKIAGDLSIGLGLGFFKDNENISALKSNYLSKDDRLRLENRQIDLNNWNKNIYLLPIPYFQYRLHFNGNNHKKFKVYQLNRAK